MKLAYVSAKYSDPRGPAFVQQNIEIARNIALQLWSLGIAVICPHTNTQHFDGVVPWNVFLDGDHVMVERSDLLVMGPNWKDSKGATSENGHAIERGIPVFEWPRGLPGILRFCHPNGIPAMFGLLSKQLLDEELYEYVLCHTGLRSDGGLAPEALDVGKVS